MAMCTWCKWTTLYSSSVFLLLFGFLCSVSWLVSSSIPCQTKITLLSNRHIIFIFRSEGAIINDFDAVAHGWSNVLINKCGKTEYTCCTGSSWLAWCWRSDSINRTTHFSATLQARRYTGSGFDTVHHIKRGSTIGSLSLFLYSVTDISLHSHA